MQRFASFVIPQPGLALIVWTGLAAVVGACTKTVVTSYERQSSAVVEYAYINTDADFSRYTRLTTDGLEIYYPESETPPPAEDIERIRASFRRAFSTAIGDDYQIVDISGPDILKVRAQLIDMKIAGRNGDYSADGLLRDIVARGELTFVMELIDSESGTVLARAGDQTRDALVAGESAAWEEVDRAADYWAGLFRDWLDRSLNRSPDRTIGVSN